MADVAPPLWVRLRARLGSAEHLLVQRLAGTVFLIRVASAGLAFGSQVLLARWMGSFEFGIYVYVWTWVLLIGQVIDFGLGTAAQRFIPEYRTRNLPPLLRGFITGSRWLAFGLGLLVTAVGIGAVYLLAPRLDPYQVLPLYLACITLPAYAIAHIQDGIARSYDWMGLAMVPTYIARQLILTVLMAVAVVMQLPMTAVTAMAVAAVSLWLPTLVQLVVVDRRLAGWIDKGPRQYAFREWFATSLPILMVEGFYALLAYTDVLVLQQFRPPDEVAVYYAAAKTLALVAFIHYSIAAATAHRFSSYHISGDRAGLAQFLAQAIRWTFWPSLAATALLLAFGRPILHLFGAGFTEGYHLMFILALGLLARAAIGPIERLLNMLGEQRMCALVHAGAFVLNLALCLALIPRLGSSGAAVATATALIGESIFLFVVTKRRLGFHVFVWGRA
ncbi:MAG: lipopolysaccharide biosynthesis protein [Hyphomicrobiales bacterium]|nr:lipopolysaccharide biosynthesis protein [Hyphomicrobiales bacterium]